MKTTWIGVIVAAHVPTIANPNQGLNVFADTEIGLREDGVVVWKNQNKPEEIIDVDYEEVTDEEGDTEAQGTPS